MADTKVSALTAVGTPAGTDELPVNQGGVSKKITLSQIGSYVDPINNASVANQGAGFAVDTYLTGSQIALPVARLQAKTMYRCKFNVSKTAAGIATPIINVRIGTAQATTDAGRVSLTFAAQTAAIDAGFIEVFVTFRSVGSGTSAVISGVGTIAHQLAATGLSTSQTSVVSSTGAGFDSTTAGTYIGLSVNGGTSAAWTVNLVQAELFNLA